MLSPTHPDDTTIMPIVTPVACLTKDSEGLTVHSMNQHVTTTMYSNVLAKRKRTNYFL